ncbi:MAG: histidine phosphatase family protein [Rhizomicrobium sp.]
MTRIILTRHGHVEGIDPPRFRGRREIPLSALWRKQAQALAKRVAATRRTVAAVYASPMHRCVDTGAAIADACGLPVSTLDTLLDLDYGAWEWKAYAEMRIEEPELFARWFATPHLMRFPGGESLQDLVGRGEDVLRTVLARYPDGIVVLVGHASIDRAILMQVLDQPLSAYWRLDPLPCALSEFVLTPDRVRLDCYNDTSHLADLDTIGTTER